LERSAAAARLVVDLPSREACGRLVVHCRVEGPALVLGSAQSESLADREECTRLGLSVVRRRSGGGAILVAPGAQLWVDAYLPTGDPLLARDLSQSFAWFGHAWADAISALSKGAADTPSVVAPGRAGPRDRLSRLLCFAATGPGEVTLGGRKVVGISQRRDRKGAWFHSMALLRPAPTELVDCLLLRPEEKEAALSCLLSASATLGEVLSPPPGEEELLAHLLAALPGH
jgi:lipoate-protein ligase A